jgi:hypothetical protein
MLMKPNEDDWRRAALVCREVAELPDRTSSDLNPDEMVVTGDELQPIVAAALAETRGIMETRMERPDTQHPGASVLHEIFHERERQIVHEGFDISHDDDHGDGQLCRAAMGYCQSASTCLSDTTALAQKPPTYWPWEPAFWKPKSARRDLIRAAALIVAEIERLDRCAPAGSGNG